MHELRAGVGNTVLHVISWERMSSKGVRQDLPDRRELAEHLVEAR